jgi:hypothetical protein
MTPEDIAKETEADELDDIKSEDIAHALDTYDEDFDLLEKLGIRVKPMSRQIKKEDMTEQQKADYDKEQEERKAAELESKNIIAEAERKRDETKKKCEDATQELENLTKERD